MCIRDRWGIRVVDIKIAKFSIFSMQPWHGVYKGRSIPRIYFVRAWWRLKKKSQKECYNSYLNVNINLWGSLLLPLTQPYLSPTLLLHQFLTKKTKFWVMSIKYYISFWPKRQHFELCLSMYYISFWPKRQNFELCLSIRVGPRWADFGQNNELKKGPP